MVEKLLAGVGLAACVLLLLRMVVGPRRRHALDARLRRMGSGARRRVLRLYRWRASSREAQRQADEVINRARKANGKWEGNVYTPESFRGPRKPTDTEPH